MTKGSTDSNCWSSGSLNVDNEDSIKRLVEENARLKDMLENYKSDLGSSEELLKLSETRTEAGQVKLSKKFLEVQHCIEAMKKKDAEIDTLKYVIKDKNTELENLKSEF